MVGTAFEPTQIVFDRMRSSRPYIVRFTHLILAGLMGLIVVSCGEQVDEKVQPILAEVGEKQLTLGDVLQEVPPSMLHADSVRAIMQFTDRWMAEQLWIQEAERRNLDEDEAFLEQLERAKTQLLIRYLQEKILSDRVEDRFVKEEDVQIYYQEHKDKFILNEKFLKVWMISAVTRQDAVRAREDLMRGIAREKIYEEYHSNDGTQSYRGELFHPISRLVQDLPEMKIYLKQMGRNELSPVLSFQGKYHFLQIVDIKTTDETPDLQWLLDSLQGMLVRENSAKILNSFIRSLSLQAETNRDIERMPEEKVRSLLQNADT